MKTLQEIQAIGGAITAILRLSDEKSPVTDQYPYEIMNFDEFSELHDDVRWSIRNGVPTVYSLELKCEIGKDGMPKPFEATLAFRESRITKEGDPNYGKKAVFANLYRSGMESEADRQLKFAALAKRAAAKYSTVPVSEVTTE